MPSEAKEDAVKEEEVRKNEMPTDATTDAVKEEEITGKIEDAVKEEEVREKEMPSGWGLTLLSGGGPRVRNVLYIWAPPITVDTLAARLS